MIQPNTIDSALSVQLAWLDLVVAAVSVLVAMITLFFLYQKYKAESAGSKLADDVVKELLGLKSQLYGIVEAHMLLASCWKAERTAKTPDGWFEDLEQVYREHAGRLAESISRLESSGNLLHLFDARDELFVRILGLRDSLRVDERTTHPLHTSEGDLSETLTFKTETLKSCVFLLERLAKLDIAKLRASVKRSMKALSPADDLEEIDRLKKILEMTGK